ncbi:MAG: hypothetical protein WCG15_05040, partial [Actinomycetes bacterium]
MAHENRIMSVEDASTRYRTPVILNVASSVLSSGAGAVHSGRSFKVGVVDGILMAASTAQELLFLNSTRQSL